MTTQTLPERNLPKLLAQHFDLDAEQQHTQDIHLPAISNRSNEDIYLEVQQTPLYNVDNRCTGQLFMLKDISERKLIEKERKQHIEDLKQLHQIRSDFFAGISHEFRTPLTLSMGPLQDLLSEDDDSVNVAHKKQLQGVLDNNHRLLSLVNQLLDLSQLDVGEMPLHQKNIRLDDYVPGLISAFEHAAEQNSLSIHFDIGEDIGDGAGSYDIYFDPDTLSKVIFNILSNAIKNTQVGGNIRVSLSESELNTWQLSIADDGCGIPEDYLPHIFERFFSRESVNSHWQQSTGIGLALVKQLLELQGASISVNSVEGEGSEFILQFPKAIGNRVVASQLVDSPVIEARAETEIEIPTSEGIIDSVSSDNISIKEIDTRSYNGIGD